jgi:hypothetical protein
LKYEGFSSHVVEYAERQAASIGPFGPVALAFVNVWVEKVYKASGTMETVRHLDVDVPQAFEAVTQISVVVPANPVKFTVTAVVPSPPAIDEPAVVVHE